MDVWGERRKRISTPELNRVLRAASLRQAPPAGKLGPPKIFYATQVAVAPPTFVFFARHADQVHFSYKRFLENQLRAEFGFDGTPIRLIFRERASDRAGRERGAGKARRPGGPHAAAARRRVRVLLRAGNPVTASPAARRRSPGQRGRPG